MTKITSEVITECADNLLFRISEPENRLTLDEFDAILAQMSFLGRIKDIDKAEPLTFPVPDTQVFLREDVPCAPIKVEQEMKMVPSKLGNQVKLPKVVI